MKPNFVASLAVFLAMLGLHHVAQAQSPLGTAFTYQGQLKEGGVPADGVDYDFRFRLFDDPEAGAQVGSALFFNDETVENGLFTLELDFGAAAFNGNALWLEVGVKRELMEPFSVLSPRQPLNATPFALYALDGPFVSGFWDASGSDIHNTNTGKVGVGTSNPDTKLHVEGGSDVEPDQGGYLVLGPIGGGNLALDNNEIMARNAGGTSRLYLNNGGGDVVVGGATGGNLGIGAVPEGLLHVTRPDDPDIPAILLDRSGGYTRRQIDIRSDDDLRIARTGIRDDVTISGTGLVGIGTTSPSAALEVYKPIDSPAGYVLELTTKTMDNPDNYTSLRFDGAEIDSTATLFGVATLSLNANEAGDVTLAAGGGNVGIGTFFPTVKLDVAGTARVSVLEISGADVAEKFPVSEEVKPGMVVAIDQENAGQLCLARGAYNRCVAGVVSGANGLSAGAVLGNTPGQENSPPIALGGRVWVYCDATEQPIEPGDLLTTSDTPGHAMKVTDHAKAQGAIIGKAMTSLDSGRGPVLVLVSLQ